MVFSSFGGNFVAKMLQLRALRSLWRDRDQCDTHQADSEVSPAPGCGSFGAEGPDLGALDRRCHTDLWGLARPIERGHSESGIPTQPQRAQAE